MILTFAEALARIPRRTLDAERDRIWAIVLELATDPDGEREPVATFLPAAELRVIRIPRIRWVLTPLPEPSEW